jgi:hypothetical protein
MLAIMFGSTIMLPPRTKRWAEAKVLVDCINIKVYTPCYYKNVCMVNMSQDLQIVPVQQRTFTRTLTLHITRSQIRRFLSWLGHRRGHL